MISLYNLEATLSGCVLACDRLNKHLSIALGITDPKSPNRRTGTLMERLKWAFSREREATAILEELQRHKLSLTLILNIIHCKTIAEAAEARDKLQELVQILRSETTQLRELVQRRPDQDQDPVAVPNNLEATSELTTTFNLTAQLLQQNHDDNDDTSIKTTRSAISLQSLRSLTAELKNSRAYRRFHIWSSRSNGDSFSIDSNCTRTGHWSMLSEMSLGDLSTSVISVLELPISTQYIWDAQPYLVPSGRSSGIQSHSSPLLWLALWP